MICFILVLYATTYSLSSFYFKFLIEINISINKGTFIIICVNITKG